MAGYVFDPRSSRYRAPSGRYVSQKQLHGGLLSMANASGERMAALTTRLQAGSLMLAEWQSEMMSATKSVHTAAALAGHGGKAMFSPADYAVVSVQMRQQYQYLRSWAQDIASGQAPLDDRLVSRARLYARSSLGTFDLMRERDARNSGAEMVEKNFSGSGDPCRQCPGLDLLGWVPLGSLPPVGSRACVANCRCRIERRLVVREEAA